MKGWSFSLTTIALNPSSWRFHRQAKVHSAWIFWILMFIRSEAFSNNFIEHNCMLWFPDGLADSNSWSDESFSKNFDTSIHWQLKKCFHNPKIIFFFICNQTFKYTTLKFKAIFFYQVDWRFAKHRTFSSQVMQYIWYELIYCKIMDFHQQVFRNSIKITNFVFQAKFVIIINKFYNLRKLRKEKDWK